MRQCSEALFEHPEQIWAFKIAIQGDHFEHLQLDNVIMPSVSEWGGPVGFSITLNGLSYGFYFLLFISFLMTLLGLRCCVTFSLVVANEDYCLVVALGLLVAVASLVAEHRLWGMQASVAAALGLWSTGSIVWRTGLVALRHVGSSWTRDWTHLLHWQADSLPLSYQGSPIFY